MRKSRRYKGPRKVVYTQGENIVVFRYGITSNEKIVWEEKPIVQTYTFARAQWELIQEEKRTGKKITMKEFFALDSTNCLDCPFSGNRGSGGCYTHKMMQYTGFKAMLRSIKPEQLTSFNDEKKANILAMSENRYVRFGTYGEPSLIDINLVASIADVATNWTGYTHQWGKEWAQEYKNYFMASVHTARMQDTEWREFQAVSKEGFLENIAVGCPASKEADYKSACDLCGLCSGLKGKGKKDVKIIVH